MHEDYLKRPWRAGSTPDSIVCDPVYADHAAEHVAYYGGYCLAESMMPDVRNHVLALHNSALYQPALQVTRLIGLAEELGELPIKIACQCAACRKASGLIQEMRDLVTVIREAEGWTARVNSNVSKPR